MSDNSIKMIRVFFFSTAVSLITVLLPVIADAIMPKSWGESLAFKVTYPIAAAFSALYLTWRIEIEKKDLKNEIIEINKKNNDLEEAYNEKHKFFQKVVIAKLTTLATSDYESISLMKKECGEILKNVAIDKYLNLSAKQMIGYLSTQQFNKPTEPDDITTKISENKNMKNLHGLSDFNRV